MGRSGQGSQDQVDWKASQKGYVDIKIKDKNTIILTGLKSGRVTLKASYLGYDYDVVINVQDSLKKLWNRFDLFGAIAGRLSN